ncbi:MAG: sulfotransferase, partial [Rhodospirillaceae bacterium]|nr:sulfotransferase [Rhodospirillaceae bacterium]
TDKMPGNFLHLGMISTLFPKARIIHCRREPLDVCLSCYSQNFTAVMPFSRSLTNLGHYWRDYARLMDHWHAVLPGRILDMDYATMVGDQEAGSRRLIEWCGLDWDDSCLNFH